MQPGAAYAGMRTAAAADSSSSDGGDSQEERERSPQAGRQAAAVQARQRARARGFDTASDKVHDGRSAAAPLAKMPADLVAQEALARRLLEGV